MKEEYLIYLRKSRSDMEAELRGEGETLLRHEKALKELANNLSLHVTAIYREIVSGETIAARPYMQQLLREVEIGHWAGVLVMEIERLARGDTIDQGIMAQTFKYSSTKIITPLKTYDPNNEFDEEYFEFGLFMSRREYKTINRRLQRGRTASIKEGKYVSSIPPYGYCRMKLQGEKGFTLEIIPEEANIIRCIYQWYVYGEIQPNGICEPLGFTQIARKLNALGIKPRKSDQWSVSTIRDILKNEVYTGKVRWNFRPEKKTFVNGKQSVSRPYAENVLVYQGRHSGIIEEELFDAARQHMAKNKKSSSCSFAILKNPLAGLVNCGICGHTMSRKPYRSGYRDTLVCQYLECNNASIALTYVENAILFALEKWTKGYEIKYINQNHQKITALKTEKQEYKLLETELKSIQLQKDRIFDAFEKGMYNTDIFAARCKIADSRQKIILKKMKELDEFIEHEKTDNHATNYLQEINQIAEAYRKVRTIKAKNILLREVFCRIDYTKHIPNERKPPDCFEIKIYPNYKKL